MSGYIAEMRKLVGHRTIIQCGASIICADRDGRILLGYGDFLHYIYIHIMLPP